MARYSRTQRVAITGFNSSITDVRFLSSPTDPIRFPSSLTIYYSTTSTTSLDPFGAAYTGSNGGLLVPTFTLIGAAFTPVPGSTSAYLDIAVQAPVGTQTLLFDVGSANGVGDRIAEVQAFVPEPSATWLFVPAVAVAVLLSRRREVSC